MPYFFWRGIELGGTLKKGKMFAVSQKELDRHLFKRHIALLEYKTLSIPFWQHRVRRSHLVAIFRQLASLVEAGVLLPDALHIIAMQNSTPAVQQFVYEITNAIQEGNTLSVSLQKYPHLTNDIMIQLIEAGNESGNLSHALSTLTEYLEGMQNFTNTLRSALMLPLITLSFFIVMVVSVFVIMVPYFAQIIRSINKPLPGTTKVMLAISEFLTANYILMISFFLIIVTLGWLFLRTKKTKHIVDVSVFFIPFLCSIIKERFLVYYFQSLALLVEGGIPLVTALKTIGYATNNHVIKNMVEDIEHQVSSGISLSYACSMHDWFFSSDISAMIEVGEESGKLAYVLQKISTKYREQLNRRLSTLTRLMQPMLMIILGLLVLLLILGVYLPIFNLSYVV